MHRCQRRQQLACRLQRALVQQHQSHVILPAVQCARHRRAAVAVPYQRCLRRRRKQQLRGCNPAAVGRPVQWRRIARANTHGVSARRQQQLDAARLPVHRSRVQRRASSVVCGVDIGAGGDERTQAVQVAVLSCHAERREVRGGWGRVGALGQAGRQSPQVAYFSRQPQAVLHAQLAQLLLHGRLKGRPKVLHGSACRFSETAGQVVRPARGRRMPQRRRRRRRQRHGRGGYCEQPRAASVICLTGELRTHLAELTRGGEPPGFARRGLARRLHATVQSQHDLDTRVLHVY